MSVNLSNIFRRCSVFHNILQYRIKQSSNLIVCTRKLHLGLFMKENNLFQRAYLLSSVGITDIAKRNATKKGKITFRHFNARNRNYLITDYLFA